MKDWKIKINEERDDLIQSIIEECLRNQKKILDDFFKAYIAARIGEKGFKEKVKKLVLIRKETNDSMTVKYWFEVKRGRNRKEI